MRRLTKRYSVIVYFMLVYALAWSIWIPAGMLTESISLVFVLVGAWAPTIAAITLSGYLYGWNGIRALLRHILVWRVGIQWYAFALLAAALIGLIAIMVFVLLGGSAPQPTFPPGVPRQVGYLVLPLILLTNVFVGGPLSEEFGWRGFALPHLQGKISAFGASLVIGIVWGAWHLPFFAFKAAGNIVGDIPLWAFVLLTTAWSVLFTWVYNHTRGSLLLAVLYHTAVNTTLGSLGLIRADAGGVTLLVLYVVFTWLVALLVTALCGPKQLKCGGQ
jgi:membrane protease YdiL (CAAX protease family)